MRWSELLAEAAQTVRVYHGTDAAFKKFGDQFRGSSHGNTPSNKAGFHFSDSPEVAKTFGNSVLQCDVTFQRPYVVDAKGQNYSQFKHRLNDILDRLDRSKYDGIILKNYLDAGKHGGDYLLSNHYIPFSSGQIKVVPNKSSPQKVSERLAQEIVHHNPSAGAIKALTKGGPQRFVISKDGDLYVGDAYRFTHQQIFPAMMATAVRGYFYFKDGEFVYRTMGPFDNIPRDHDMLRMFERSGIHPMKADAEVDESFMDKVSSKITANIKPNKVTPQRGRSMPGSDPLKNPTRRKRYM
jgi:hypothetical protein